MAKARFYMYTEYLNYLDGMDDSDQALLFRTILKYENGDEIEELTPAVRAVFSFIKARLDNLDKKYEETCKARSEAGSKGGKAKASNAKQKLANASKSKQTVADNDNDNDNDKKIKKEKYKKEKLPKHHYGEYGHVMLDDEQYKSLSEMYGEIALKQGIENVDSYCEEKGKTYSNYLAVLKRWGIKSPPLEKPMAVIKPPDNRIKYDCEDFETKARFSNLGYMIDDDGYWIDKDGKWITEDTA